MHQANLSLQTNILHSFRVSEAVFAHTAQATFWSRVLWRSIEFYQQVSISSMEEFSLLYTACSIEQDRNFESYNDSLRTIFYKVIYDLVSKLNQHLLLPNLIWPAMQGINWHLTLHLSFIIIIGPILLKVTIRFYSHPDDE